MAKIIQSGIRQYMELGFPTHTKDMTGRTICLGDRVKYIGETGEFSVVFENNAFRKHYEIWDEIYEKPFLDSAENYEVIVPIEEASYHGDRLQILKINAGIADVRFDDGSAMSIKLTELQPLKGDKK